MVKHQFPKVCLMKAKSKYACACAFVGDWFHSSYQLYFFFFVYFKLGLNSEILLTITPVLWSSHYICKFNAFQHGQDLGEVI